jgi:uncharacterized surface protein with fasciclin (FAS1) repeats
MTLLDSVAASIRSVDHGHQSKERDAMLKSLALGTVVAVLAAHSGAGDAVARAESANIVQTAVAAGSFKTLAKALEAADLVGTLSGPGPFTVFAPTDDAFATLPVGTLESLLAPENKQKLRRVLAYHVVPGKVMAADVMRLKSATAVSGDSIAVTADNGIVRVDQARVIKTDIAAANGVIHVIDAVILPRGL